LIGHVVPGAALGRGGAQPGDDIWVTGTIGDAALGLQARLGKLQNVPEALINRSLLPKPRIGLELAGVANAAIDISDGLLQDLGHLCTAGNLAATIRAGLIPFSEHAAPYIATMLETMLNDGDDYELLLAVPPDRATELLNACGDLRITKIGSFSTGAAKVRVLDANGEELTFSKSGWQHFGSKND
jgi:thiamine-monophosphate kinase